MEIKMIRKAAGVALLWVFGGCSTLPPPADLLAFRSQAKDEQAMQQAKTVAPEQFKAAMQYSQQAEQACADNETEACQHYSALAKFKLGTAMEHAARANAEQRRDSASTRMHLATRERASEIARQQDLEGRIVRMEKILALQHRVSNASSTAEAERAKLAMEREKTELAQTAYAHQKQRLDVLLERDALFEEASLIVGADNVKRVKRGIVITVRNLFDTGKASVRESRVGVVERLAALVSKYENYPVVVEGYTDSRGRSASNLAISQSRAQAVMNRMLAANVGMTRVKAVGYGKEKPITDNSTRVGRALNRRTEIVFLFPASPEAAPKK